MCGINGLFRFCETSPPLDREELIRTRDRQARRGPDGAGEWLSTDGRIALGHRRLAILDLSEAGAQPMATPDGRYRIVYNGEIYNFRELRAGLERDGVAFRSESDTEVILALWAREGPRALARLRGMYAFAVWDGLERSLTLARDPFGIKPLYYSDGAGGDGIFRFASQVRALEAGGALPLDLDPAGLAGFLLWGSVPEPATIRRAIRALPAGHVLIARQGGGIEISGAPAELDEANESPAEALERSVRAHLVSDVPVAVFLSSGLDSALLAALAARHLAEPPTTFTVRFEGWEGSERDEGPLAARVAAALGTRHVERRLTPADVAALWPEALAAMDQPSIDGFNTFLVARAAHEVGIKVALSGLGGDELLGGYPSFRDVPRWQAQAVRFRGTVGRVPGASRLWRLTTGAVLPSRPKLRGLIDYGQDLSGTYFIRRGLFLPEELSALIGAERAREGLARYDPLADARAALGGLAGSNGGPPAAATDWLAVQRLEVALYLRNQLLRDSDWAAMASSVELRVPLVDRPLWRSLATAGFEPARSRGKAAFYRECARALGLELLEPLWRRPKTGFAVPLAEWVLPRADGARRTGGGASRRLALRLLEEWGP